jgi:CBS domain-containing protein
MAGPELAHDLRAKETAMRARELMSVPVVTCHVNDAVNIAAQRMSDRGCGAIAVVNDNGVLTGMITDRDICMAALTQGKTLDDMLVNSAMTHHVVAVHPDQSLSDAEQLMMGHQIRRVPVIDDGGAPIGMISLDDIALECAQPDSKLQHGAQKLVRTLAAICRPQSN